MEPRAVLKALPGLVRPLVPSGLRSFRSGAQWAYLMKIHYGNPALHYEASRRPRLRTIEVALHFEADELTNARLLGAFRTHERAIHRTLPNARFEEWDKGWARIWEPIEAGTLDAELGERVAAAMAAYITTLEPILRDELPADVPWSLAPAKRSARRRTPSRPARTRGEPSA